MQHKKTYQNLFIALILLSLVFVLQHFIKDVLWGGIIAILTYPLFNKINNKLNRKSVSAITAILIFGAIAVLPALFTINTLGNELKELLQYLQELNKTGVPVPEVLKKMPFSQSIIDWWNLHLAHPGGLFTEFKGFAFTQNTANALKQISTYLAADLLHIVIATICAWVLLANHNVVSKKIFGVLLKIMPDYSSIFLEKVPKMLKATAFGLGSVALLEGLVLGFAYYLAGAPFPILLAVMTAYLALIPGGAPFSFTAVSLIVLAKGLGLNAVLLFSWGAFELFMVDKFIRPKLIGHEVGLPFLAVLLSLLGGVSTLGVLGLFIGPVLMTMTFAVLKLDDN